MPTLPTLEEIRRSRPMVDRLMNETLIRSREDNPQARRVQLRPELEASATTAFSDIAKRRRDFDPSSFALEMAGGPSLAMFAGPMAKTANQQLLAKAKEMFGKNATPDQIWKETGWFQGTDKKWRFEIPDNATAFNNDKMHPRDYNIAGNIVSSREGIASEVMPHQKLFDAYPDAAPMSVGQTRYGDGNFGTYHPPSMGGRVPEMIGLDAGLLGGAEAGAARSSMLHELQHSIQNREGFAGGGNPRSGPVQNPDVPRYQAALRSDTELQRYNQIHNSPEYKAEIAEQNKIWSRDYQPRLDQIYVRGRGYNPKDADAVFAEFDKFKTGKFPLEEEADRLFKSLRSRGVPTRQPSETLSGSEVYSRLAGEVEARNVQTRMDMTPEQRQAKPPWMTEDVPRDQQIVDVLKRFGLMGVAAVPGLSELLERSQRRKTLAEGAE